MSDLVIPGYPLRPRPWPQRPQQVPEQPVPQPQPTSTVQVPPNDIPEDVPVPGPYEYWYMSPLALIMLLTGIAALWGERRRRIVNG